MQLIKRVIDPMNVLCGKYRINFWRAEFAAPEIDSDYRFSHKNLSIARGTFVVGALLFMSFGLLDMVVVAPEQLTMTLLLRLGASLGMLLVVYLSYHPAMRNRIQVLINMAAFTTVGSLLLMLSLLDGVAAELYYAGLPTLYLFQHFTRMRFVHGMIMATSATVGYYMIAAVINPIPTPALAGNLFFLTLVYLATQLTHYFYEIYDRLQFAQKSELSALNVQAGELALRVEAAADAKVQFMAVISHELRTPLNAIMGFSELIMAQGQGRITQKTISYMQDIHNSGRHLYEVIGEILEFAKSEFGTLDVQEGAYELDAIIDQALKAMASKAALKQIQLAYERPIQGAMVRVDQRLLTQALVNILSNSIKFSAAHSQVVVSLQHADHGVMVKIVDHGRGIEAVQLARVMEPFVQAENAFTRTSEGLGLGLAFVKRIVDLHQASIHIDSAPGSGTSVMMSLPATRVIAITALLPQPSAIPRQAQTSVSVA